MDTYLAFFIALYVSIALGFVIIVTMYSEYLKYKEELHDTTTYRLSHAFINPLDGRLRSPNALASIE